MENVKMARAKKVKKLDGNSNFAGYLFIGPWLIGFFAFTLVPILATLFFSFTKYDIMSPPVFIGLKNFQDILFTDDRFWKSLRVTFLYVFVSVPIKLIFALFVAMLFVGKHKFLGAYRALVYIPSIIGGSVAVAVLWRKMFGMDGLVNNILINMGIMKTGVSWIGNPSTALWTIVLLAVWEFGSPMLIFLAGLKQIPVSFYEAADIDGANKVTKFFRITIPMLAPVLLFNFIMQIITGFRAFTESFIITQGGPFDNTLLYMLYVYQKAFSFYDMGYGCALAWILILIIAVFTGCIFKFSSDKVYYESRGNW